MDALSPEAVEALFTRSDGDYLFARWGRPIAPVVFGVEPPTVAVLKGALEALCLLSEHATAETDPELGANLMVFFCRDWGELTGVPNLDRLIEGLGPLNYEPQRGLLVHPAYVVTPGREPLGTIDAWNWARGFKDAAGERPADVNESLRWVEDYERVAETAAEMPDTCCVYVGDRESDLAPLMRRAAELGHPADWLVRALHDRVLEDGAKLFASVGAETPIGQVRFRYRPRRGVKARDVVQQLHVRRVRIGKRAPIEATCLIAREIAAPAGVKALECRLLSNRTVASEEEAAELIDWYRARWRIRPSVMRSSSTI